MLSTQKIFDLPHIIMNKNGYESVVFSCNNNGKWRNTSCKEYINGANKASRALLKFGVNKGDNIATILKNSVEWNFLDIGITQVGAVHIPIYSTLSFNNLRLILTEINAKLIFIDDIETYKQIEPLIKIFDNTKIISITKLDNVISWEMFIEAGNSLINNNLIEELKTNISIDDICSIVYTSGTITQPKGVMLSHRNIMSNVNAIAKIMGYKRVSKSLSFLPLCHTYERVMNYMYQFFGITIYYVKDINLLSKSITEVKPEIFCAVPKIIEKIYLKIKTKSNNFNALGRYIYNKSINLAENYSFEKNKNIFFNIKLSIANILILNMIKKSLGGKLKYIISGGAYLSPKLVKLFWASRIKIIEGYGLTETSPVISVGTFEKDGCRFGSVGKIIDNVNVIISDDGEIMVKGPNVMLGYYNQPELTKSVFNDDGWFLTGDIGNVNNEFISITDRKKEIFKTSGGKYIAPQIIENLAKESLFIENIIIIGENRNFISALIVPDFEHVFNYAEHKGYKFSKNKGFANLKWLKDKIWSELEKTNNKIDKYSQIKKFVILKNKWSTETGELSPTLKTKRNFIIQKYSNIINSMYDSNNTKNIKKLKSRNKRTD